MGTLVKIQTFTVAEQNLIREEFTDNNILLLRVRDLTQFSAFEEYGPVESFQFRAEVSFVPTNPLDTCIVPFVFSGSTPFFGSSWGDVIAELTDPDTLLFDMQYNATALAAFAPYADNFGIPVINFWDSVFYCAVFTADGPAPDGATITVTLEAVVSEVFSFEIGEDIPAPDVEVTDPEDGTRILTIDSEFPAVIKRGPDVIGYTPPGTPFIDRDPGDDPVYTIIVYNVDRRSPPTDTPGNNDLVVIMDGGIDLGGAATIIFFGDPSGLYTLVSGKHDDTLYERVGEEDTVDVPIPRPFFKMGFVP